MTRFDDLGLAGYERGTGYRPGEGYRAAAPTLRGFLRGLAVIAVAIACSLLLWETFGARVARLVMWLALAAGFVWRGWRDRRDPLAGDEYATDEERRTARRDSVWSFVSAAIWAGMAVASFVFDWGGAQ